jgi:glycosyltransferase involved in cell wall biosynthesis
MVTSGDQQVAGVPCSPSISICIPTLGRLVELEKCFESIFNQQKSDLEIVVVSPNDSQSLADLVSRFCKCGLSIVLKKSSGGGSLAADLIEAIELATGSYCWLLSDDDVLESGAISTVEDLLSKNRDIGGMSVNYVGYDKDLLVRRRVPCAFDGYQGAAAHKFSGKTDLVLSLGMHLGFMSCQIVKRHAITSRLAQLKADPLLEMNYWIVVDLIASAERSAGWFYLPDCLVGYRADNDSIDEALGQLKRLKLSYIDFEKKILDNFELSFAATRSFQKKVLHKRLIRTLGKLKYNNTPTAIWFRFFQMLIPRYKSHLTFWALFAAYPFIPRPLFRLLVSHFLRVG